MSPARMLASLIATYQDDDLAMKQVNHPIVYHPIFLVPVYIVVP